MYRSKAQITKKLFQNGLQWKNIQRYFYGPVKPQEKEPDTLQKKTWAKTIEERKILKIKLFDINCRRK